MEAVPVMFVIRGLWILFMPLASTGLARDPKCRNTTLVVHVVLLIIICLNIGNDLEKN
jgi:hypothetical protein